MVPAMPGSKLKKKIEKRLKALNLPEKIKIVEKSGPKFAAILKKNVKKEKRKPCDDPKCLVGLTEKGGNCRTNEVVYELQCKVCKDIYYGETARNAHVRGIEHVEDSESQNAERQEKSVILKHCKEKHNGEKTNFSMKIIKSYQHDALGRQCAEAVQIKNIEASKRINDRQEYHQPGDVEVSYQKNENEEIKRRKNVTKNMKNNHKDQHE